MKEVLVQTVKKEYNSKITAGIAYYSFITAVNNISLSTRELQLLAFINYRGTISSVSAKQEFCKLFNSSEATVSNMVSKLYKLKLLVKDKSKTKLSPSLRIDFEKNVVIRFYLDVLDQNKQEDEDSN